MTALVIYLTRKRMSRIKSSVEAEKSFIKKNEVKGLVDMDFFKKMIKLVKIAIPKAFGRETLGISLLSGLLVLRTVLSIYISDVNGSIVKAIVNRNFLKFIKQIIILGLYSLPSAIVNSGMDYFNKLLGLFFRENLSKYFHQKYLTGMCYYQITNLDNRIQNPDQLFTNDIEKWAYSLSSLYSNFSKPVLDLILFSRKLSETLGYEGPLLMIAWYFLSGVLIKFIAPPFGKLTAIEQTLEGEFRACHAALITHSEEIAFYKGNKWEQKRINETFNELISHVNNIYKKKFYMGIFDSMLVKYGAVMIGYTILGLPVFSGRGERYGINSITDASAITKDYIRNSSLLVNLAKAIGRVVVSYKDLQNLSGYTYLVNQLDVVMEDVNKEKFTRTQVNEELLKKYVGGTFELSDNIEFDRCPIITPNGDLLVENIKFEIQPGWHTLISGPNGCGKSSLFRILGQLWPLKGGVLRKPHYSEIFYIPQRPYLPTGTLRDQIIYPHTFEDFQKTGKTDSDLIKLLEIVDIDSVRKREKNGLEAIKDWNDLLSGGEKQRMAMARLYYHCPKYAILDECTSAVSVDVEGKMYTHAKNLNITLITVSHRKTLWKFHDYILRFSGDVRKIIY